MRPSQYFVDWVDGQVRQMVPRLTRDLTVETTLDHALEQAAGTAARTVVAAHKAQSTDQAAIVALDGVGRVRVMVGGVDYASAPYNRAALAHRQAGSAWKPFVYLTALDQGRLPDTPVTDEPVTINGWTPSNYETGVYLGPITLETALAKSVNTVAARLADEVGRPAVAATARRVGIVSAVNTDPAMALGTTLVTPLEMTAAYATFANGGSRVAVPTASSRSGRAAQVIYQKRAAVAGPPPYPNPQLGETEPDAAHRDGRGHFQRARRSRAMTWPARPAPPRTTRTRGSAASPAASPAAPGWAATTPSRWRGSRAARPRRKCGGASWGRR